MLSRPESKAEFSPEEMRRYSRHFVLPQVGEAGQRRLKQGRVLVVGAGGLGSPLLLYLAAAGVGHIGIVDPDRVDTNNLQRQVLFTAADRGRLKVAAARERLLALNPHIDITTYPVAFTRGNAFELLEAYDIVADGTDNFPTRYLVNDACVLRGKINVYASVFRFEGQVSVFNALLPDGRRGPNYRDLFPEPPPPEAVPNCAEGGILGVLPGIIGSAQASEVIKLLTGIGEPLIGRLFLFDAASFSSRTMKFGARPDNRIEELIDYEAFCGMPATEGLPAIDAATLRQMLERDDDFLLVDVREDREYAADNLGGALHPLDDLENWAPQLPRDRTIVVHCQSGARSARAVDRLRREYGLTNALQMEGGLNAYRRIAGSG